MLCITESDLSILIVIFFLVDRAGKVFETEAEITFFVCIPRCFEALSDDLRLLLLWEDFSKDLRLGGRRNRMDEGDAEEEDSTVMLNVWRFSTTS